MKVGWLVDEPAYVGGAELTQAEFRVSAPEGVQIIECPPGGVVPDLDTYCVNNCTTYEPEDLDAMGGAPVVKYIHDLWPHGDPVVKGRLLSEATLIFTSPLHQERFTPALEGHIIPPALDLDRCKPPRQERRNGERSGTCAIAGWRNPGKGGQQLLEWAQGNGPVDVYGGGEFLPHGPNLEHKGELPPAVVAQTLWKYETFVFLPFDLEPFCRSVVEAWAAGCEIVTNNLIGARHFIESDTEALKTAASDFWEVVTSA